MLFQYSLLKIVFFASIFLYFVIVSLCDVDYGPVKFETLPTANEFYLANDNVQVTCKILSNLESQIELFHNGNKIHDSDLAQKYNGFASYKFTIRDSYLGAYVCKATNKLGSLLSPPAIFRKAIYTSMDSNGKTLEINNGDDLIINRPLEDNVFINKMTFTWHQLALGPFSGSSKKYISSDDQKFYVTKDGQLILFNVQKEMDGITFMAQATYEYMKDSTVSESGPITVQIKDKAVISTKEPSFLLKPKNASTTLGGTVFFECVGSARPLDNLQYKWYHIVNGQRKEIFTGIDRLSRRLGITQVVQSKEGEYVCELSYIDNKGTGITYKPQSISAWIVLHKHVESQLHKTVEYANEGSEMTLRCYLNNDAFPKPTIVWYKDSEIIENDANYEISFDKFELKIRHSFKSNQGVYECIGNNTLGYAYSATFMEVKSEPPKITVAPTDQNAIEGMSVKFTCIATGAPFPIITWFRRRTSIEVLTFSTPRIRISNNDLTIQNVELDDAISYICNATNNKGYETKSAFLTVYGRTVIDKPPSTNRVVKGNEATFQCGVKHDSKVNVIWRWFFQPQIDMPYEDISDSNLFHITDIGTLIIKHVDTKHVGNYKCKIFSDGGNDTSSADLIVIETPRMAIDKVELIDEKIVNISWKLLFDGNSPIQTISIESQLITNSDVENNWQYIATDIYPFPSWYQIKNLKPFRSYIFRVRGVNGAGEGSGSAESKIIKLPQQPPSKPPQAVSIIARSSSELIVRWEPPNSEFWNGNLLGYYIKYRLKGYLNWGFKNVTILMEKNVLSLKGLTIFSTYEVQIAAYNERGIGVYSDSVYSTTKEGPPSRPPILLDKSKAVTSTIIFLQWKPPEPQYHNGDILGYYIVCYPKVSSTIATFVNVTVLVDLKLRFQLQEWNITNLAKFTTYDISVSAFTNGGIGVSSKNMTISTLEDIPDIIAFLSFNNLLDKSVDIRWKPPLQINGILISYLLVCKRKIDNQTIFETKLEPQIVSYEIKNLEPLTSYVISVQAVSGSGPSPKRIIEAKTGRPPKLPHAPTNLVINDIQARSVRIQFSLGFDGYTSINLWIIEAQVENKDDMEWFLIDKITAPTAQALTINKLIPFTSYRLRILAENVKGSSQPSLPTRWFITDQDKPTSAPTEISVRAFNETAMTIRWTPLNEKEWNGNERGYKIQYGFNYSFLNEIKVNDFNANSYIIMNLRPWTIYDVRLAAFNAIGIGPFSSIETDRTLESVPNSGPVSVNVKVINSTAISVTWGELPENNKNGLILGYKIKYKKQLFRKKRDTENNWIFLTIDNSTITSHDITNLESFSTYEIGVLAYTRLGNGDVSFSPNIITTYSDIPTPPSCLYFPSVSINGIKVVWCQPKNKNGKELSYSIFYRQVNVANSLDYTESQIGGTSYSATKGIDSWNTVYDFSISAKNENGTSQPITARVTIREIRLRPVPPENIRIENSLIRAYSMSLFWSFEKVGFYELRNYTLECCLVQYTDNSDFTECKTGWKVLDIFIPPTATNVVITGLRPVTKYKFRFTANNDVGSSEYSDVTVIKSTLPAPPTSAPLNLHAVPLTETSIKIFWREPPESDWNSDRISSYIIKYGPLKWPNSEAGYAQQAIDNTLFLELFDLNIDTLYEIKVKARNSMGDGPWTKPIDVYVGEAIPSESPNNLKGIALTSTEIEIEWLAPPKRGQHGSILGYKIIYWISGHMIDTTKTLNVPSSVLKCRVKNLLMFTDYDIAVLAFNAAGEGPQTPPIRIRTKQGLPGKPGQLKFTVTSLSSLNVSWSPPRFPNGIINLYRIEYSQADMADYGTKVTNYENGNKTTHEARNLLEKVKYIFSVQAETIGWGDKSFNNVTIGPVFGSPQPPFSLKFDIHDTYAILSWINVPTNNDNLSITGYVVQKRQVSDNNIWELLYRLTKPDTFVRISFFNLKPKSDYQFRVYAINNIGISASSERSSILRTPDFRDKNYYEEWWFIVIVALGSLIIIIVVVALLCLTGRRHTKKKHVDATSPMAFISPTSIASMATVSTHVDDQNNQDQDGFGTINSRKSNRSRHSERSSKKNKNSILNNSIRSPPRPSPAAAAMNYNCFEDDDDRDSCNKSDISKRTISSNDNDSIGKRSSISDVSEKDIDNEIEENELPPTFLSAVHMETNRKGVNGHKYKTPLNQKPPPLPPNHPQNNGYISSSSIYNYTDSEPSESPYGISLNTTHVVVNNKAGSRAPLPGFSSFV